MATNSMSWYEVNEDFEGAFERWLNTTPAWKGRWFETCAKIFTRTKKWVDKYVIDAANKTIHKIGSIKLNFAPKVRKDSRISISEDCPVFDNNANTQKCYLIEFYDEDGQFICSKVGTTIRTVQERVNEELKSKTYTEMGAEACVIRRVYNCGDIPAEGAESLFRATYIRKHPDSFKKNDRFINTHFDYKEADKIFAEYICK